MYYENTSFPTSVPAHQVERFDRRKKDQVEFHIGTNYVAGNLDLNYVNIGHDSVKCRFAALADSWESATRNVSSVSSIASHPAYLQIIAIGKPAIPLILERMRSAPNHWFAALQALTNENPVPKGKAGDMDAMSQAWHIWGRKHGHLE